jgi:hypothetical protein
MQCGTASGRQDAQASGADASALVEKNLKGSFSP